LGYAFIKRGALALLASVLYRLAFGRSKTVFFQNNDDKTFFLEHRLVNPHITGRLPGSGVDTVRFTPSEAGNKADRFEFLLVARVLWDKGVGEYIEAARIVRRLHQGVRFLLLGPLDEGNPSSIPREQVMKWVSEGLLEYLGATDDVAGHLTNADCVVLPSYREGCPRSLLEAASMAIPVITTDAPGCRDVVDDGTSGYLCRLRSPEDLAEKMLKMIEMPLERRVAMGKHGRKKMIREFDERIVLERYMAAIEQVYM